MTQCTSGSNAERKGSHSDSAQGPRKDVKWVEVSVNGILLAVKHFYQEFENTSNFVQKI
jgi:hypothetical protein